MPERMVSHTGVGYVKLQHPETVIVVVAIPGGGHVVHVGELEHVVHVGHVEGVGHELDVGQVGKLVVVVVVVVVVLVFEIGGAVQLQHPEVM
jgi:hypothetical protein